MRPQEIDVAAAPHGLFVMGIDGPRVLLGTDAHWWPIFEGAPEASDGEPHKIDRWSKRVFAALAAEFDAKAVFPSDGPPYEPFIAWALATGRFWQSPTGMLIHDRAGLMISIRGALIFSDNIAAPAEGESPCNSCLVQPCRDACPVSALVAYRPYDVPRCKEYLDTRDGRDCMMGGCLVRRACPVSKAFGRPAAQSAAHMRAFKG